MLHADVPVQVDRVLDIDGDSKRPKANAALNEFFQNSDFLVCLFNTMVTKEYVPPFTCPLHRERAWHGTYRSVDPHVHVTLSVVPLRCPTDIRTKITEVPSITSLSFSSID